MQRRASTGDAVLPPGSRAAPGPTRWSWSQWARLGTLLVIVGSVAAGVLSNGVPTLATAQSWAAGLGVWAPLVFVVLYAAATVSLLPMTVLSAFAGTLFGIPLGAAVVWSGAMLGSTVAFLLSSGYTAPAAEPDAPPGRWRGYLHRHGTWAIAAARLVPVVPLGLVNYTFALSSVGLREYVLGTGIGILPVTIALVSLGDQATSLQSPVSLLVVTALSLVLGGAAVLARRRRDPSPDTASNEEPPCASDSNEVGPGEIGAGEIGAGEIGTGATAAPR